jgi:solute carrier family 45 protein 1/2/4
MIWLTIFAHGTAYLSTLDIPQLHISLIWALAPVCGAIIPPIIGVLSDRCRSPWGRRRPFIASGAITIMIAITALAWITPITNYICSLHDFPAMAASIVQCWAILWVVVLNVGIQTLQSTSRALILDICPSEQQALASAWVGRFTGLGNIFGYILGSIPLPFSGEGLEAWRFRWIAVCAKVTLMATVSLTVLSIEEESPQTSTYDYDSSEPGSAESPIVRTFRCITHSVVSMPPKSQQVCRVQFFSAMGWFGFLFYNTTYVSGLFLEYMGEEDMVHSPAHKDSGMRFATTASVLFAVLALGMNVVLPYIRSCSPYNKSNFERGGWKACLGYFRQTHILWALANLLFACLMLSTFVVSSDTGGTITVAIAGVAFALNFWAPFTLIGEEIAAQQAERNSLIEQGGKGSVVNQSGAMLGVYSMAVCVPQIVAALMSSLVFWGMATLGLGDSVRWILRLSGVAGAVAAWFAWRL